jgi:hypothetical protein
MPVRCIPEMTIRGNFDLLGYSVSREDVAYVELAYYRCSVFVDVGRDALRENRPKLQLRPGGAMGQRRFDGGWSRGRRRGGGVGIVDRLGNEDDGREGSKVGIEEGWEGEDTRQEARGR